MLNNLKINAILIIIIVGSVIWKEFCIFFYTFLREW